FGFAGFLKVLLIKLLLAGKVLRDHGGTGIWAWDVGYTQQSERREEIWPQQCTGPSHLRTPVVSHDDRLFLAQGLDKPHHIAREVEEGIRVNSVRAIGLSVAALVWRDDVVPCLR